MGILPVTGSTATLKMSEIYASILGESTFSGWPGVIVRLAGCPLRCVWCDSAHALKGGEPMTLSEIVTQVTRFGIPLVLITGGEPLMQAGSRLLVSMLLSRGFRVVVETGGGVSIEGVDPGACIILDVKCPDSGMHERQVLENLDRLKPVDEVKFVIASREDYEWARDYLHRTAVASRNVVHFSPVESLGEQKVESDSDELSDESSEDPSDDAHSGEDARAKSNLTKKDLAEWILEDRLPVRLNLQQHIWIWGSGVRGV